MQHASHVKDIGASDSSVGALSLPLEIWIEITKCFWDIHNVVRLLAVCKPLRSALLQSPQLWVKLNFNTEDLSTERHYPAPNMCNIMSFLNNLPSRSVQSIQWRPESSDAAKEIILYVMEKFEYIRELNIRPHLGNPSSQYLIAACEAVSELNQNGIQRRDFKQLLISNTSYRYEVADLKNCNRIMNKLQKGILALQGKPNAAHASSDIGPCHDLALCQVCKAQFARTCGKPICLACPNNSFKVCLSCSEYCSVCDQQVCPEHDEDEDEDEPDVEFLDGRCYHGDGEVLHFCDKHEDNLCDSCDKAQCSHHLETCSAWALTDCKYCIDCGDVCQTCEKWFCVEHMNSPYHTMACSNPVFEGDVLIPSIRIGCRNFPQ